MPWSIETGLTSALPQNVVRAKQVHGGSLVWAEQVGPATAADGIAAHAEWPHPFVVTTADCIPLVVLTPDVACALHVSRKTLLTGLLDQVPKFLAPAAITGVHIGPHICAEHFVFETIGPEIQAFQRKYPYSCHETTKGLSLDINRVVEEYLKNWSVDEARISRDGRCTFESPALPSYLRALRDGQRLSDGIATSVRRA